MKNGFKKTALIAAVLLSALWCRAQQPGELPPPQFPPARVSGNSAPPHIPGPAGLTQLVSLEGRITNYTANDRYEYDTFALSTGDKTITVKFPAPLAAELMKAAPKGASATISGNYDESPEGTIFRMYSLKKGSNVITDAPLPVDMTPPADKMQDFSGTISDINHDPRGMINSVILNGKTIVSLPPPAVEQLAQYLKTGVSLSGTGIQRAVPQGVVTAKNMNFTDARTLSIRGQTYLIR